MCTRLAVMVLALLAALVGAERPASAFKQSLHRTMTRDSCTAAGLPRDLCARIAAAAYNTDASEWNDLGAHAQAEVGERMCTAANRVQGRMHDLGWQAQAEIDLLAAGERDLEATAGLVGELIGRACHTLQDSYAHHGMTNPEHAWYSLQDQCDGTSLAPDLRPGAAEAARTATDALMAGVAAAVRRAGVADVLGSRSCPEPDTTNDPTARGPCDALYAPTPWGICSFLGEAEDWDGVDRQWDNDLVVPALLAAFVAHQASDLCQEPALEAPPAPAVDVSDGTRSCASVHVLCLGKADAETPSAAAGDAGASGGCNAAGAPGRPLAGLGLLLALGLALRLSARRTRR